MPIYHLKKVPSHQKILHFGHSVDIIRSNKGAYPYMGIPILTITLLFLVQSQIILYRDAQEMVIYQIGYLLRGWGA